MEASGEHAVRRPQQHPVEPAGQRSVRIAADHLDEIDDIYAEHMTGIDALPGHLTRLMAASGLLFKVAIARRVREHAVAMWCRMRVRIGLMRAALAHRRTASTNPA